MRHGSFQKCNKSRLLEMAVTGQRFRNATFARDDE
jgi:hypothetical protein